MEFRASTFYFTGVASGTSTPFVIETGGGIQSTLGRYTFPDTSGTSQFIYLGRWSLSNQSGNKLYMKIISGSGFNADNAQNQVTEVFFKTSNGSSYRAGSTGNYFADGQVWKFGMNNDAPNYIRVVAVDNVTYDFYGYFGNFTGNYSFYEVSVGSGSWTNSGSLYGTSSPSGNYIDLTQNTSGDACKAWVNFNASSGSAVVRASAGVTSVTRNGVSDYTVNFSIVFRDSSYSIAGSAGLNTTSQKTVTVPLNLAAPGTSSVRIQTPQNDGAMGQDAAYASIVVMR